MIEDKLILQQASKKNIKASEEEVDEKFNDVKSQFADAQEFEKILQSQGLTVSDLKDKYEEQIMIKKLINREVRSKINLSPTEIYQYYKEHKEDFKIPAKAEVQTILIRKKDADNKQKDADKERIEEIKKMLEEEENFSELALKYSEDPSAEKGGKMGYIKKDEMMDKVDKVIFSLEEGETSDIIETSVGYHIFKITDKKAGSIKSFEEARPEIENILFQDKAKARYSNWMESLKENAYISIK
jgi:parvulin-like peptidyl-prolyl isomerase